MTTRAEIEQTVTEKMVGRWGIDSTKVTPDARLGRDLGADSLDLIELVMDVEDALDIDIPDEAIDGRCMDVTVNEVFDVVEKYVTPTQAAA